MKKYSLQQRIGSEARPRSLGTLQMLFDFNNRSSKNETNQNFIGSSAFGYQMKITDEYSKSTFKARTFAENNLVHCECLEILSTMYTQMIEHSQASGKSINKTTINVDGLFSRSISNQYPKLFHPGS